MLLRLVTVKEDLETPETLRKIRQILQPREYTKVDEIIDLVFSTARDVREDETFQNEIDLPEEERPEQKKFTPVNFRDDCILRIQKNFNQVLVKRSAGLYSSSDGKIAVICLNSRRHERGKNPRFWFGFHKHQKDTLQQYALAFIAFGCGSAETILQIPVNEFVVWLPNLNTTETEDRFYWHVHITENKNKFFLLLKGGKAPVELTQYLVAEK